ncbi:MAG: YdiU family protein, partial [Gammaproteobacteria bacterium]|nr:YdiU family protein [Gammaproteobacteria bacterium]
MSFPQNLKTNTRYSSLPDSFYRRVKPQPLNNPYLLSFSPQVAELLDIDPEYIASSECTDIFTGNQLANGSDPIAMIYSGHQFGQYVPQLGDGRALMLGEIEGRDGNTWEIQLKGSGLTPFSRMGDGRAVMRSTIREFLCSEAMAGLGIPTTRALCLTASEDEVYREKIESAAVLTRVARSHVRFGTFEIFFYRQQYDDLKILADFIIEQFYPASRAAENPYLDLLEQVIDRTASLIAQWQLVGFTHGVMNSDNMSILGLTFDYGPYGFLDTYTAGFVCNHSDHQGRYAYDQQPRIGLFNLGCLAQALLPLIDDADGDAAAEQAKQELGEYQTLYTRYYEDGMRDKLGLIETRDDDDELFNALFNVMEGQVDFTNFFRALSAFDETAENHSLRDTFIKRIQFDQWADHYSQRLRAENSDRVTRQVNMRAVNPKYVLRNYMAQSAISMAENKDFSEVDTLLKLLTNPFDEQPEMESYAQQPPDWAKTLELSCS